MGVDNAVTTRRDEVVCNQMRLGCVTFSSGFRFRPQRAPPCALCGQFDGPGHALLQCCKLSAGRCRLSARVHAERVERIQQMVADDVRNGRSPRPYKLARGLNPAILTKHPDAVFEFLKNVPVWSDQFNPSRA